MYYSQPEKKLTEEKYTSIERRKKNSICPKALQPLTSTSQLLKKTPLFKLPFIFHINSITRPNQSKFVDWSLIEVRVDNQNP